MSINVESSPLSTYSHSLLDGETPQLRSVAFHANRITEPSVLLPRRKEMSSIGGTLSTHKINTPLDISTSNDILSPPPLPSSVWAIRDDLLPPIPPYYPLLKTHMLIRGVPPSVVASRISQCMRTLSIAAIFDNQTAIARAETTDHARFVIRLYSSSRDDYCDDGIIVELQRTSGSTLSFHNCYRVIIRASKGLGVSKKSRQRPSRSFSSPKPFPKLFHVKQNNNNNVVSHPNESDEVCHYDIRNAIEIANGLLKKDRLDANLLGMESLQLLTEPSQTRQALNVAKAIVGGDGECCCDIRERIICLIKRRRLSEEDHVDDMEDDFDRRHFDIMHNHALAVLANSLNLLAEEGTLEDILRCQLWLEDTELIAILINEVKTSSKRPHDAYLSARCLRSLVCGSNKIRVMAVNLGALAVMELSHVVGQCGHELLARESVQTILVLKGS